MKRKVEKWKQDKKTVEEISAMLYHTIDENEYNDWIISEEVMAARRDGITNQERALWGNNKEQVMRCKVAYAHIDELNPKGQKTFRRKVYRYNRVPDFLFYQDILL